jgi:ABC-type Mn2+/Zn2+ transport system ATPase subunit
MNRDEDGTLLRARNLEVGHRDRALLPPLDLAIGPGEFWGLIGSNGSGKTTLLRTLLGMLPRVGGEMAVGPGIRLAYVPQRGDVDPLIPGRALDVVMDGLDRGWQFLDPLAPWRRRGLVRKALAEVGAEAFAHQRFSELSEGQKQRVLVAGALVSRPDLLVLDEPTSAMDQAGEHAVFDLLDGLRVSRRMAVLVVSHHTALLMEHVSHLVFVDRECGVALAGRLSDVAANRCFQAHFKGAGFEHPETVPGSRGGA